MNYDTFIIEEREKIYNETRENVFIDMCKKHCLKKCSCIKNKKCCNVNGTIDLSKFNDTEYIKNLYRSGTIESIYNIMQSITQSLKANTGFVFEKIIEKTFLMENIEYSKQVQLEDGHIVDFTIPPYTPNFKGIIISCKTTLRERYLQDKYINSSVITITIDKDRKKDDNIIYIDEKEQNGYFL